VHSVTTMRLDEPRLSRHAVVAGGRGRAGYNAFDRHLVVPAGAEFVQTVLAQPRRGVRLSLEASLP
jgi:hypothetical protein